MGGVGVTAGRIGGVVRRECFRRPSRAYFRAIGRLGRLAGLPLVLAACAPAWIVYDLLYGQLLLGLGVGVPVWLMLCLVSNAVLGRASARDARSS